MDKPISIVYEELFGQIAKSINKSGLPAFIVIPIIKDVLNQLEDLRKTQFQLDSDAWSEYLRQESNTDSGEENE